MMIGIVSTSDRPIMDRDGWDIPENRPRKQFWVADELTLRVREVTGYFCDGTDYWWFPDLGYSAQENVWAFTDRERAKAKLGNVIAKLLVKAGTALEVLNDGG